MASLQSVLLGEALSKGGPMRMTKTLTRLGSPGIRTNTSSAGCVIVIGPGA